MKDLEIRGAGDMLGGEQSGFMAEMGFETYQKIMAEAIEELKESEFKELFEDTDNSDDKSFVKDCQIDTDFEILLPDDYVNNISERLLLYNKLNTLKTEEDLTKFEEELVDRFGNLPIQTVDLLNSMKIKWMATDLGFERLIMKKSKLICYFVANPESEYYKSELFTKILGFAQLNPRDCKLKEKTNKAGVPILTLVFENVDSIDGALNIFNRMTMH